MHGKIGIKQNITEKYLAAKSFALFKVASEAKKGLTRQTCSLWNSHSLVEPS